MDIDQLKQLDAIATHGTISAAADELHIPQPTLSRSIRRLEQELGHDLLLRQGRHVELNAAGRLALDYIRPMLRDERLLREALDRLSTSENALRIGTVAPAPLWHLTSLIVERFPDVILSSTMVTQQELERTMLDGTMSMGICNGELRHPSFLTCPLMEEDLSVSLPADHPLAGEREVTFRQLDGETFLLFSGIGFWREVCDRRLPRSRFIVQEDREVFVQLATGTSNAFFTTNAPQLQTFVAPDHVVVPIADPDAHASFRLALRADAEGRAREVFDWITSDCHA